MTLASPTRLDGAALDAWRSFLRSHATILRGLDAELVADHGMTTRDYEVLLVLAHAPDRRLPMSALAESTMLTRSGITRLVDGLVRGGLIERRAVRARRARVLRRADRRRVRDAAPRRREPRRRRSSACSSATSPRARSSSSPRCSRACRARRAAAPARWSSAWPPPPVRRRGIAAATALGAVVAHRPRPRALGAVLPRRLGLERARAPDGHGATMCAGDRALVAARRRPLGARRSIARATGPVPPGDPAARPARAGRGDRPAGPRALAARRRLRSPRQRGALPLGPGRQRHRDLPRPPARRVAAATGGVLQMATLPLDLDDVLAELGGALEAPPRGSRRRR